ncbi:MAG TPA: hypothetical protein VGF14_03670 [Alphaproteobacteria bacterium]
MSFEDFSSYSVHAILKEAGDGEEQFEKLYKLVKPSFFDVVEAGRNGRDTHRNENGRKMEQAFYAGMLMIETVQGTQQAGETIGKICNRLEEDSPHSLTRNWAMYNPKSFLQNIYSLTTTTTPHPEGVNGKVKVDSNISKFVYGLTEGGRRERRMLTNMRNLTS